MSREEEKLVNDCEVADIMRNELDETDDFEDKWVFPKPRYYLATVLDSGSLRPLSPTLKEHSPVSTFPDLAMLNEGFDNMREWRNAIEFVRFITKKKSLFNSRHHWNMRTKFLEVRLQCMDKIVEDPFAIRLPVTEFYIPVSMEAYEAMEEEKRKKALEYKNMEKQQERELLQEKIARNGGVKMVMKNELVINNMKRRRNFNGRYYPQKEVEITVDGKDNVNIKNNSSFDEKLRRKSQQKELNVERQLPANELPGASPTECGRLCTGNDNGVDNMEDLLVTGKALQSSETIELESQSFEVEDELVLEDINNNDYASEGILPSARKLKHTLCVKNDASHKAMSATAVGVTQTRTVSRFQRLRRRIRSLFSCFRNNQVTPVNI